MSTLVASNEKIVAMLVPNKKQLPILPRYFPTSYVQFENTVYTVTDKICDDYSGGFWNFYELSNGGFYMAPSQETEWAVSVPFGNGYTGQLSSDALGIVACLYTYCFLAESRKGMAEHYHFLRDYVDSHAEASAIWWAID